MSNQTIQQNENDWRIDANVNDGFPYACPNVPEAFDYHHTASVWRIHSSVNDGFPYIVRAFELTPEPSAFPRFTGFSLSGIGRDFKPVSESSEIFLPETVQFQFQRSDAVSFRFSKFQEVKL